MEQKLNYKMILLSGVICDFNFQMLHLLKILEVIYFYNVHSDHHVICEMNHRGLSCLRPVGEVPCPPCTSVTPDRRAPRPYAPDSRAPRPHVPDRCLYLLSRWRQKKCLRPSHSLTAQPVETATASQNEAFCTSDPQLLQ